MPARPIRVGIEGPCCAGKTTLSRQLRVRLPDRRVHHVPDYSDFVGGGRFLPPAVPDCLAREEQALRVFLDLEVQRTSEARAATDPRDVIVIDRSAHTLLAHCDGLRHATGADYTQAAQSLVACSPLPLWPDLIIYLDTGWDVIAARNRGKFANDSILVDPTFNTGIASYFHRLLGACEPLVVWLDARADPRLRADATAAELTRLPAGSLDRGGTP